MFTKSDNKLSSLLGLYKLLYVLLVNSDNMAISDMIQNIYNAMFKQYNINSISKLHL